MVRFLWLIPFLVLPLTATNLLAQSDQNTKTSSSTHIHSSQASDFVDGAKTPELIPDLVAYRLYFITVSELPHASAEQRNRQLAYLSHIGLRDGDLQWTISVLENFKAKYNDLVAEYNKTALAAERAGQTADYQTFVFQRDDLVRVTRENLRSFLSPQGLASLHAHIRSERKHMKLGLREVQP